MRAPCYDGYDDALDAIQDSDIALKNGNSNHAPMVVEALCALGRPQAVAGWLDRYRPRLRQRAPMREPIAGEAWRAALGGRDRFPDWTEFFARELDAPAWPVVLERWVARLAPGFCAAATHGVIRVGHAVRALSERETPSRRRELADALASWAATWQALPDSGAMPGAPLPPDEAMARVPFLPVGHRPSGNIVTALTALAEFPEFAPVAGLIATDGSVPSQLARLCELFARLCLTNVRDIPTAIAFIHGVTSLTAFGHIACRIDDGTARAALRYAWQSGAALFACYGSALPLASAGPADGVDEARVEQAIANGDEHLIKFTEACLCRNAAAASPAYFAAIDRVADIICRRAGPAGTA